MRSSQPTSDRHMDQRQAIEILSGRRRGAAAGALRAGTWVLSKPYAGLMRLRRGLYRIGVLGSRRAPVPVISVGNLTTGGTGKTPMVAWVIKRLKHLGCRPAILTRGYKAVGGRSDEAELLFQLTGCPVVVSADRASAAEAAAEAGADALVMDDGFQHQALRRDLDIVLIDATEPFGFGHCLPRGLLREPPSALRAAGAIVITRCDRVPREAADALAARLAALAPRATIHRAGHVPSAVVVSAGRHLPPAALAGQKVCAFCGIGNPESFFATLESAGATVVGRVAFDDHVAYGPEELERVRSAAAAGGAEVLVTTAKDRVKLEAAGFPLPLWTLQVEIGINEGEAELADHLRRVVRIESHGAPA